MLVTISTTIICNFCHFCRLLAISVHGCFLSSGDLLPILHIGLRAFRASLHPATTHSRAERARLEAHTAAHVSEAAHIAETSPEATAHEVGEGIVTAHKGFHLILLSVTLLLRFTWLLLWATHHIATEHHVVVGAAAPEEVIIVSEKVGEGIFATKELFEDVISVPKTEMASTTAPEASLEAVSKAATKALAATTSTGTGVESLLAVFVVNRLLFFVRQDCIGLTYLLKGVFSDSFVVWIFILRNSKLEKII